MIKIALMQQSNPYENVLLIINTGKTRKPLFRAQYQIEISGKLWEKDFTVTFKILKIFFLLYIARYWCTFCCNWYCTWGIPLVFNTNHCKPKNKICSWNWNTGHSSQVSGFFKCLLNNTLVSWLSLLVPAEALLVQFT